MDGSQCSAAIAFLWPSSNGCMHSTAPAAMAEPAAQSQQPAVDTDAPSFAALPNNFARDLSLPAAQSRPHPGPACLHARPGAVVPVSAASSAPPTSPFFVGQQTILHSASYPLLPIISTARPCGDSSPSSSASSSPTVSNNRPNALYKARHLACHSSRALNGDLFDDSEEAELMFRITCLPAARMITGQARRPPVMHYLPAVPLLSASAMHAHPCACTALAAYTVDGAGRHRMQSLADMRVSHDCHLHFAFVCRRSSARTGVPQACAATGASASSRMDTRSSAQCSATPSTRPR